MTSARVLADETASDVVTDGGASPGLSDSVWFDSDTGSVVPLEVSPRIDDSVNRSSRWLPKPKTLTRPEPAQANAPTPAAGGGGTVGGGGGFLGFSGLGGTIGVIFVVLLAVLVGTAMYFLMNKLDPGGDQISETARTRDRPDAATLERISQLPPELRRTDVNMRAEAERLMKQGRFDLAIILLFGHQLLMLDRHGLLRLSRGKTNRRYVRECRSRDADVAGALKSTVRLFDRSFFGEHEIKASEFEQLWRENGELEQRVAMMGAA